MTLIIEPILDGEPVPAPRVELIATKPLAPKTLEGPNPEFFITDQLCACGCGNQMPSTIVARGWQFLRGHKQGAGVVHNGAGPKPRAVPAGPVKSTGLADALTFLRANEKLLAAQEERAAAELEALDVRRS